MSASPGPGAARSPGVMRQMNAALILKVIREHGPLARAQIAAATGLSKPTVNGVVDTLVSAAYVSEADEGPGRPRRPGPRPRLLTFRADVGHVLGIDVGADKALVMVADLTGAVVASERRAVSAQARLGHPAMLRELRAATAAALQAAGIELESVVAAGVGTPGVIEPGSGRIALAPQLEGWEGLELGDELERALGCPVAVDNETNLSLLAELAQGAARGAGDVLYVQAGVGIGGALSFGGRLHRGSSGAAGEIGYLVSREESDAPEFGSGPFEWEAGGRAYARLGATLARQPGGSVLRELAGGDPDTVTAETVFAAVARGDRAATDLAQTLAERLGRGIASAVIVLDPEVVILGGGLANAGGVLLDPVRDTIAALVPRAPRVVLSALGDESVATGAVRLALDRAEQRLFRFDDAIP